MLLYKNYRLRTLLHTSTQTPASTHNTLITHTQSDKYALGRTIHENTSKMAPRWRVAPKNVASLREPLKGSLAAVKGNPFAALDVYDRCYLLELPGELRNRIYTYYLVEGAEDRARLNFEEDQVEKEQEKKNGAEPQRVYSEYVTGRSGVPRPWDVWFQRPVEPPALLFANQQIKSELTGILTDYAPFHVGIDFTFMADKDGSNLSLTSNMTNSLLPSGDSNTKTDSDFIDPKGLALTLNCDILSRLDPLELVNGGNVWTFIPDEEWNDCFVPVPEANLNLHIATSKELEDLGRRLRACSRTEDLVITWGLGSDSKWYSIQYLNLNATNVVFESLVQLAEAMPNLRRYSVQTPVFSMYASRKKDSWASPDTVRLTREFGEEADGELKQLLEDLHVLKKW